MLLSVLSSKEAWLVRKQLLPDQVPQHCPEILGQINNIQKEETKYDRK